MSQRLRVFISSTMRDLRNERAEVIGRLQQFNFEPVNAESWLPTGKRPWERIQQEIASSNVFVLLLGESYGYLPTSGPKAGLGKSVTHLEYLEAREAGLPILPFFKQLPEDVARDTDDAKLRDDFRREVADWNGQMIARFELARDLCDAVGRSLVELLSEEYQDRIRDRAAAAEAAAAAMSWPAPVPDPALPAPMIDAIRQKRAVLFAGAGMSLESGYPSAAAWCEFLVQRIRQYVPDYAAPGGAENVRRIASDLQLVAGQEALLAAVQTLMTPPHVVGVSDVHRAAVQWFDTIVTSNFDNLFETAARDAGLQRAVLQAEVQGDLPGADLIAKLHGSFEFPDTMILTEEQANAADPERDKLCDAVRELFARRPVIVLGSSLRDPTTASIFSSTARSLAGYYVVPYMTPVATLNAKRWNLQPVAASAAGLFRALDRVLASSVTPGAS